ncbi:hypothetical protein ACUTQ5_11420 [Serratia sp. NA_112.1]
MKLTTETPSAEQATANTLFRLRRRFCNGVISLPPTIAVTPAAADR